MSAACRTRPDRLGVLLRPTAWRSCSCSPCSSRSRSRSYDKVFIDVVRVTLETDRIGNQLQELADVKIRGIIVGEVRSVSSDGDGATLDLALDPEQRRHDPGRRRGAAAAQDPVRREVRRPRRPGERRPAAPSREGDVITQDRSDDRDRARAGARRPAAAAAGRAAGRSSRDAQRARVRAGGPRRAARREPRAGRRATSRSSTRRCRRSRPTSPGWPTSRASTPTPPPTCCACCATLERHAPRRSSRSRRCWPRSSPARRVSPTRPARLLDRERAAHHPRSGRSAARRSRCSPSTRPIYPCLPAGPGRVRRAADRGSVRGNGELHITLEVVRSARRYQPGRGAARASETGPECYGLPNPPASRSPGCSSTTAATTARRQLTRAARRARRARRPDQRRGRARRGAGASSTALLAPPMGSPADDVPDIATLLFGPVLRGTEVNQSVKHPVSKSLGQARRLRRWSRVLATGAARDHHRQHPLR